MNDNEGIYFYCFLPIFSIWIIDVKHKPFSYSLNYFHYNTQICLKELLHRQIHIYHQIFVKVSDRWSPLVSRKLYDFGQKRLELDVFP